MRRPVMAMVVFCIVIATVVFTLSSGLKTPHARALHPMLNIVSLGLVNVKKHPEESRWLVKLTVSNAPNRFGSFLYIKASGEPFEAQLGTNWVQIDGAVSNCALSPSNALTIRFAVPERAVACRVRFKYTGSCLIQGRLTELAKRLPSFVRSILPRSFWVWAGPAIYGPEPDWIELDTIVPIPIQDGSVDGGSTTVERSVRLRRP